MKLFKAFGLKKAPKRFDRDAIMEGWGPEGMSEEERREMEGRDESYGEYVERKIGEEDDGNTSETFEEYQQKFPKTDFGKPEPFQYPPGAGMREPVTSGHEFTPTEPGEGVPIKGREETPKQKSERHYQMSERPQSHSSRGQTLADKRQGRLAAAIKMIGF